MFLLISVTFLNKTLHVLKKSSLIEASIFNANAIPDFANRLLVNLSDPLNGSALIFGNFGKRLTVKVTPQNLLLSWRQARSGYAFPQSNPIDQSFLEIVINHVPPAFSRLASQRHQTA
jgi:hypothetical protein